MVGTRSTRARLFVGPSVSWVDQSQIRQTEVGHGARHHSDILSELGLDQNDGGSFGQVLVGSVRAGQDKSALLSIVDGVITNLPTLASRSSCDRSFA